jgi:hypothetical protein
MQPERDKAPINYVNLLPEIDLDKKKFEKVSVTVPISC